MADDNFNRTIVLMVEHTEQGALGVVLNRPGGVPVEEILGPWAPQVSEPAVMFVGGPVEREAVLALGSLRDPATADASDTTMVVGAIGVIDLSADPDETAGSLDGLRLFSGYAGWSPAQLEAEIDAGGWIPVDADPHDVLTDQPEDLWRTVLGRQPDPALRRLALYPSSLTDN